jgi:hypothetical protein
MLERRDFGAGATGLGLGLVLILDFSTILAAGQLLYPLIHMGEKIAGRAGISVIRLRMARRLWILLRWHGRLRWVQWQQERGAVAGGRRCKSGYQRLVAGRFCESGRTISQCTSVPAMSASRSAPSPLEQR